jgi:putative peptide zinc metalloprotease protein
MPYDGRNHSETGRNGTLPRSPDEPGQMGCDVPAEPAPPGQPAAQVPWADEASGPAKAAVTTRAPADGQGTTAAALEGDFDTITLPRLVDTVIDDELATLEFPRITAEISAGEPARSSANWETAPVLAPGVELMGEYQGSGLKQATFLARTAAGQVAQLSRLLWLVLGAVDGTRVIEEIAVSVSAEFGRTVSAGNVEYLLETKLIPLGMVASGEGAVSAATPDAAILALRLRGTLIPDSAVQVVARLFQPLFLPPIVIAVLGLLVTADLWLVRSGRLLASFQEVLARPLLLLIVLGLSVVSMAFHECGHAAACRYGGARPGRIGMGLYVMWPAMFTNVTDSYRLGRAGRIRTDLGGVYFNAVFAVVLTGAYFKTGYLPLAATVVLVQVELAEQLMPSLRLDGYFILTDLAGVPDLFRQIRPVLRSLIPGRPADPRVGVLRRASRLLITGWVLVIVPLLSGELALLLVGLPGLATAFTRSVSAQADAMTAQFGRGDVVNGLLSVVSFLLLLFPAVGTCYVLLLTGRLGFRAAVAVGRKHPVLRAPLAAAALAAATGLAAAWGLLPPPGLHHAPAAAALHAPAAAASLSPASLTSPEVSGTNPPWPTLLLSKERRQPPAPGPKSPARHRHRSRRKPEPGVAGTREAQVPFRVRPSATPRPSARPSKSPAAAKSAQASRAPKPSPKPSASSSAAPSAGSSGQPSQSASSSSATPTPTAG